MGFININGQQVHTSNIASSNITISGTSGTIGIGTGGTSNTLTVSGSTSTIYTGTNIGGGSFTIQPAKTTYHILGEDVEVEGYKDFNVASCVALINVLGKPYYDELKKQDVYFPSELEEYLEKKFVILERDRKINEVIKDKKKK